jgi:hypothetical protein
VLWFFGADFAASLAVCLLVLPPLLLPSSSPSPMPPLSSSMHLASPMLLLLLLSRDFCRPSRGEWVEAEEVRVWDATATPSLRV